MKTLKITKVLTLIISSIFILCSCSNKLDRDTAMELIIEKYDLPVTVTDKLINGMQGYSQNTQIIFSNDLVQKKLITFTFDRTEPWGLGYHSFYDLKLTSEGQKYLVGESNFNGFPVYLMKVAETVFGEITGMKELNDGKLFEVEYTLKYANVTPFGEAFSIYHQAIADEVNLPIYNSGESFNRKVLIAKYDDGWRIE